MTMKELLLSICEEQKAAKAANKTFNVRDIWSKIGSRDSSLLEDLGCTASNLDEAIEEFIKNNPYNNID
jgi:hypothetical protein